MDSYTMEVFAETRRQGHLDEAERRRLLRSGLERPGRTERRGPRWSFAIVRRLARVAGAW